MNLTIYQIIAQEIMQGFKIICVPHYLVKNSQEIVEVQKVDQFQFKIQIIKREYLLSGKKLDYKLYIDRLNNYKIKESFR